MMSKPKESFVEVISTDFRHTKVKVTSEKYMIDVKNEACQKLNLSPDKYLMKHKQKIVDLTSPFRTSGLVQGAKLELVVKSSSPSVVAVRVDVEGTGTNEPQFSKTLEKIPNSMSLWQVLRQVEEAGGRSVNITARATPRLTNRPLAGVGSGQLYWEAPVISIMRREYTQLSDLQKTLSQCGIDSGSSRVLLRVSFRASETTLQDAMAEVSRFMGDVEDKAPQAAASQPTSRAEASAASETTAATADATMEDTTTQESATKAGDAMETDNEEAKLATQSAPSNPISNPLTPTGVFSAPSSSTPAAALTQDPDSMFEPSIAHAKLHQQSLQQRSHNTRLKSDAELAAAEAERVTKLARVRTVTVKVKFPDNTSAQWNVHQEHAGAFLYKAVRSVMRNPERPFKLIIPGGGRTVVDDSEGKKLIAGYGIRANVVMNLLWEDTTKMDAAAKKEKEGPFLMDAVASRATNIVVPEVPMGEAEDDEEKVAGPSASAKVAEKKPDGEGAKGGGKVPKWMKLGKK